MPSDFATMFPRLGWEAIEEHYAAGQRTIKRWLCECGELDLITRRRSYLRKRYAARGAAGIGGRKPGRIIGVEIEQPVALLSRNYFPVRHARRAFAMDDET